MIEENCRKRFHIVDILKKANDELKILQEKLKTNSLVKIHVIEKTHFSLFKIKKSKVLHRPIPNKPMINYVQSIILSLHEEYNKGLDVAHSLGEVGPKTAKEVSSIVQSCFSTHLHLAALEKADLAYFEKEMGKPKGSITLHEAERFLEESICDFRILKEQIIEAQYNECQQLPITQPNY